MSTLHKPRPILALWLNISFVVIALLGFIDASYLTIAHYSGAELVCGPFSGCASVTTSKYATFATIPVALLGALYYLFIFLISVAYLDSKNIFLARLRGHMTWLGLLASSVFVYLQLVVLKQICTYCMLSALDSTLLWIMGMYSLYVINKQNNSVDEM